LFELTDFIIIHLEVVIILVLLFFFVDLFLELRRRVGFFLGELNTDGLGVEHIARVLHFLRLGY
jgi:hypothetical protein